VVLSCEHGGNRVPSAYAFLFAGRRAQAALASHRGYDPGALDVARALARRFKLPLHAATVTRLLVELNRSHGHRALFSEFSADLSPAERKKLIERHYLPHREAVAAAIQAAIQAAPAAVLHIAVHSFAPVVERVRRRADIGLLYDSTRPLERALSEHWQRALAVLTPELRVRRNYPYLGKADGLTTALRRRFPPERYLGIELEINQALLTGSPALRRRTVSALAASLDTLLNDCSAAASRAHASARCTDRGAGP
jgi:predicted N-formylglutamate amidohydrolase